MLCDHGQIFFFFVSDTDHHRVTLSECEHGSPLCSTVRHHSMLCKPCPPGNHRPLYSPTLNGALGLIPRSPVAVVMFGKGHTR